MNAINQNSFLFHQIIGEIENNNAKQQPIKELQIEELPMEQLPIEQKLIEINAGFGQGY